MIATLRWIASIVGLWAGVAAAQGARPVETVPGMPPVPDPTNLYSETRSDKLSPAVAGALPRIYVPNRQGNDVTVIDPATMKVVDRFAVGIGTNANHFGNNNNNFLFASGNGVAGAVTVTVGQADANAEALILTGANGEGVTTANLGNAGLVATAFNAEFNITAANILGFKVAGTAVERYSRFAFTVSCAFVAAALMHQYLKSHRGRLAYAIRDNELRVEYMGASVQNTIHVNYVISAVLAGVGGALAAITVGHIDPEMAYWTTSGEFVFVGILSGTGSVLAPFLGAVIFESIRSFAYEYSPNTWQMALGITMLLVIMFLPGGLWSLFRKFRSAS